VNEKTGRQLTGLEATGIVVGAGVGGGVMAVPFLAAQTGLLAFFPIVVAAFALNVLLNLMLTEVLLRDGGDLQIVELIRKYLFRGTVGGFFVWMLFGVLTLSFVASLTAYVVGAGDVLSGLTTIPAMFSRLLVYAFSAIVVFFGIKGVGLSEKVGLIVILAFSVVIGVGSIGEWSFSVGRGGVGQRSADWKETLALYGIVMYSLNAAFAIPQAVCGLGRNPVRSVRAVVGGTAITAGLVTLVTVTAIAVSRPGISRAVTEVAVIGIGAATGPLVAVAGSLFVIFAMVTTYWSVSLALSDIISQRLRLGARISWLIATAPTLGLIAFNLFGFVESMQIAGGIVALVIVAVTVPLYVRVKSEGAVTDPGWTLGRLASPVILAIFIVGMVLMALGSSIGAF